MKTTFLSMRFTSKTFNWIVYVESSSRIKGNSCALYGNDFGNFNVNF